MAYKLLDCEEITTQFQEITNIKLEPVCNICKQNLIPVAGKEHLLKCNNCSKYSLTKKQEFNTNVTIVIGIQILL